MFRVQLFLFLLCFHSFSQKVQVLDAYSKHALKGVVVHNLKTDIARVTNNEGIANLFTYKKRATLVFKHKAYHELKIVCNQNCTQVFLTPKYENLKDVVLSVSRVRETKNRIPEKIEIATKKDIQSISPQTSADLLANINGVRVQKSQLGGGSPVIRGMESNRVLLVVDGVRMNNAIYRSGHLQNSITISPQALERVEIVFGPASVTYGSDALGGVVHYYTKRLNYSSKLANKQDLFYRHSTVNKEQTVAFSSYTSHQKWASYTNISYSSFKDLRMGNLRLHGFKNWGKVVNYSKNNEKDYYAESSTNENPNIQKNTGYNQLDVLQKLKFPIHKKIDLLLNSQYSTSSNIPNFGKLNDERDGALRFAEWFYGPQKRFLFSAQTKFNGYKSLLENGTFTAAYQNISESRINRRFGSLNRVSRKENVAVFSLNGDFYKNLSKKGQRKLYYGVELVHNKVNSKAKGEELAVIANNVVGVGSRFMADTRYPNRGSFYTSAAIYTSYRQRLNKKQTLNLGLRLTSTRLKARWNSGVTLQIPENEILLKNTALTGSIGYICKPKKDDKISLVISKGFRSPNVDDVGKIRAKSGNLTVPNTNLKPEHLYSTELGYTKRTRNKKVEYYMNIYYTLLSDYISRSPSAEFGNQIAYDGESFEDNNILANSNQGNAYIYGGTLGGFWKIIKPLKFTTNLTYTKGRSYDKNIPLSSIPPLFGNVSLGLYKPNYDIVLDYRFSLEKEIGEYNLVEGIDNIEEAPNGFGTPFWSIMNINSNYRITDDLKVQLQLQNILDIHYKEFGSSISAPGRNFVMALAYSF